LRPKPKEKQAPTWDEDKEEKQQFKPRSATEQIEALLVKKKRPVDVEAESAQKKPQSSLGRFGVSDAEERLDALLAQKTGRRRGL